MINCMHSHIVPFYDNHGTKRTPYAIHCREHNLVFLDYEEYDHQMNRPNSLWQCPICMDSADWCDEAYEQAFSEEGE